MSLRGTRTKVTEIVLQSDSDRDLHVNALIGGYIQIHVRPSALNPVRINRGSFIISSFFIQLHRILLHGSCTNESKARKLLCKLPARRLQYSAGYA